MVNLVLNEWVWADLAGDNGQTQELEAFEFLQKVYSGDDRIILVTQSRSMTKLWSLCKEVHNPRRIYAKYVKTHFVYNSSKCLLLDDPSLSSLPEPLNSLVNIDDQYLVRAILSVNNSLLITTDLRLKNVLDENKIACRDRNQYLSTY